MIYSVAVSSYEDITSSMGEIITTYIVQVIHALLLTLIFIYIPYLMIQVYYTPKDSYILSKRYSDFSSLYICLKDYLPQSYRFPNKSIFNNNAQFTKERRLRGFDELLKRLLKSNPKSVEFQAFLEIPERMSLFLDENKSPKRQPANAVTNSANNNSRSRTTSSSDRLIGSLDSIIGDDDDDTDEFESDSGESPSALNDEETDDETFFTQLNQTVKKDFLYVLRSSFRNATIIYILGILVRIIDVSKSSFSKMILTWIAMGLLLTYLRIIFFKVKRMKSRKIKSD